MDLLLCFKVLGLEKTTDLNLIKNAYREILPTVNPEDDKDGFMRLREAYDTCTDYAKYPEKYDKSEDESDNTDNTPIGIWLGELKNVYNTFSMRRDIECWRKLFDSDICVSLDTGAVVRDELLVFLSNNYLLPIEVWELIDETFHIIEDFNDLRERFPENFLQFVRNSIECDPLLNYKYFKVDDSVSAEEIDSFINLFFDTYGLMKTHENAKFEECFKELCTFNIYHPYLNLLKLKYTIDLYDADIDDKRMPEIPDETKEEIEEILRRFKEDGIKEEADVIFFVAKANYLLGNVDEAVSIFEKLNKDESLGYAYDAKYELALHNYLTKNFRQAYVWIEELLNLTECDERLDALLKKTNNELINEYTYMLENDIEDEKHPGKLLANELAWKYFQIEETDKAIDICEKYGYDENSEYEFTSLYSRLLVFKKDYKKGFEYSLKWYNLLLEVEDTPENYKKTRRRSLCCELLVECYIASKDYDNALKYIDEAIGYEYDDNTRNDMYVQKANILLLTKRYKESIEVSSYVLSLNDSFFSAYLMREEAAYYIDDIETVMDDFKMTLRLYNQFYRPYSFAVRMMLKYNYRDTVKEILDLADENGVGDHPDLKICKILYNYYYETDSDEDRENLLINIDELSGQLEEYKETLVEEYKLWSAKIEILAALERFDEAIKFASEMVDKYPEEYVYYARLGDIYSDDKYVEKHGTVDIEKALKNYEKAISMGQENNLWYLYSAGYCASKLDDIDKALMFYERILDIDFEYGDICSRVIEIYEDKFMDIPKKEYRDKINFYATKLLEKEENVKNLEIKAKTEMTLGYCEESIKHFEKSLELKGNSYYAHRRLGGAYKRLRDYDKALEHFKKALKLDPAHRYSYIYYEIGYLYQQKKEFKKAIEICKKALIYFPDMLDFHKRIGDSYLELGRYEDALDEYNKMDKASKNIEITNVYYDMGDLDKAKATIDTAADEATGNQKFVNLNLMGDFYLESMNDYEKALSIYIKSEKEALEPDIRIMMLINMIKCYIFRDEMDKAKESAEEAYELITKTLDIPIEEYISTQEYQQIYKYRVGFIYFGLGDYEKAAELFTQMDQGDLCINCHTDGCYESFLFLAILYMKMGRIDEAKEKIDVAVIKNGRDPFVRNMKKMLESM